MKYSFVLPAYKARFLKEAIDSILAQTYTDFELIIVNDASPEDLDSIVHSYDDPRIQYYINEENIGGKDLVRQWNHSISYADGEYLILASDDDVYSADYLKKMNTLIEKYPHVSVFRPQIQIINEYGSIIYKYECIKEYTTQIEFFYSWMKSKIGSGIAYYIFKRTDIIKIGGFINFPCAWGSDDATVITLSRNGACFYKEQLFSFRLSGENITSRLNTPILLKQKIQAYIMFEQWIKREIGNMVAKNLTEYQLLIEIKNDQHKFIAALTRDVLNKSSLLAIIRNIRLILSLEAPIIKPLIKVIIKKCFFSNAQL